MYSRLYECCFIALFLLLVNEVARAQQAKKVFDITKFGAVGNGQADNTKAFQDAFANACQYNGDSAILIPKGTFLVESAVFRGPCKGPIEFSLLGIMKAPAGPVGGDHWVAFRNIDRLAITGSGTFDGQGETAWRHNDCAKNPNCRRLPISVRLDSITNSVVRGIASLNSKNFHMNIFRSKNIRIEGVHITAPAESPNTDGIHLGDSQDIWIVDSVIATGDDCVSVGPGSKNIEVLGVRCGPGHGISIGSLGKYPNENDVSGFTVKNCKLTGTDNGLRIKTWASHIKLKVHNITYDDVIMENVYNPIVIDQQYCPSGNCDKSKASSVQIQDVWFKNIRGSSKSQAAVTFSCSSQHPCNGINLRDVNLPYHGREGSAKATCLNVRGSASGIQNPAACF